MIGPSKMDDMDYGPWMIVRIDRKNARPLVCH